MRTVVVATDFSSAAREAVHWGAALAAAHEARLLLVQAVVWPVPAAAGTISAGMPEMPAVAVQAGRDAEIRAGEQLEAFAETLRSRGLRVETVIGAGPPAPVVLDAAVAAGADLVVTGTHARTGVGAALLGSTAAALVAESPAPVLTVRDGPRPPAGAPVVVATDFSPDAEQALAAVAELLRPLAPLVPVVLLHAYHNPLRVQTGPSGQLPEDLLALADAVGERLEHAAAPLRAAGFPVEPLAVETTAPAAAIAETAHARGAALVVLGVSGGSLLRHLLLGRTTPHVLPRAGGGVLTARAAAAA